MKGYDILENMIENILKKETYNVYDLAEIVKILRSENGCPWDKVQTHQSIRKDFLEEVYEVLEAIDYDSSEMLREELGDVLLQVLFHCEIENEKNIFDIDDVANDICKKLIIRHPHVFSDVKAENVDKVLKNWDNIKKETKGQETYTDTLKSVPKTFPSLMKAQKLGKRANRAGIDFSDNNEIMSAVCSQIESIKETLNDDNKSDMSEKIGKLLFLTANLARKCDTDAEEALGFVCEDFIKKFEKIENENKDFSEIDPNKIYKE